MDDFIDLVQPNSTVSMGILLENRIYSSVRISLVYKNRMHRALCGISSWISALEKPLKSGKYVQKKSSYRTLRTNIFQIPSDGLIVFRTKKLYQVDSLY